MARTHRWPPTSTRSSRCRKARSQGANITPVTARSPTNWTVFQTDRASLPLQRSPCSEDHMLLGAKNDLSDICSQWNWSSSCPRGDEKQSLVSMPIHALLFSVLCYVKTRVSWVLQPASSRVHATSFTLVTLVCPLNSIILPSLAVTVPPSSPRNTILAIFSEVF